jgi:hypothetical protein
VLVFDVCEKFEHLQNLLKFAEGADDMSPFQQHVARTMYPSVAGSAVHSSCTRGIALTVMRACAGNLKLKLSKMESHPRDALSLEKVTPQQQKSAHGWITAHWHDEVRSLMGRHHPKAIPAAGSKGWYKFVRSLMRIVFGFGLWLNKSTGI